MKYVYLALNWVFGIFFGLMGVFSLVESPLGGLCLIAISALLLPPIANAIYSKTNIKVPLSAKVFIIIILLISFGMVTSQSQDKKTSGLAAQKVKEQAENAAKAQRENIDYFKNNRDKIISSVSKAISNKNYQSAVSQSSKYLSAKDDVLIGMHTQAKKAMDELMRAEIAYSEPI